MSIYIPNDPNQRGWFDPHCDVIALKVCAYCDELAITNSVKLLIEDVRLFNDGSPVIAFVLSDGSGRFEIYFSTTLGLSSISYANIKPPEGVNCLAAIAKIDTFLEEQQNHNWAPSVAESKPVQEQETQPLWLVDGKPVEPEQMHELLVSGKIKQKTREGSCEIMKWFWTYQAVNSRTAFTFERDFEHILIDNELPSAIRTRASRAGVTSTNFRANS
jgi:hypothetical protein